jgi:hypothetical protein
MLTLTKNSEEVWSRPLAGENPYDVAEILHAEID